MACPHATPRADRQQKNIIWERLDDVGGDTDFCDATFKPAAPTSSEDPDHLLALQLARDDEAARERAAAPLPTAVATEVTPASAPGAPASDYQAALALQPRADADADMALARQLQRAEDAADAALARQLQAEEDAAARSRPPPPPAAAQARPLRRRPPKKSSSQCVVA